MFPTRPVLCLCAVIAAAAVGKHKPTHDFHAQRVEMLRAQVPGQLRSRVASHAAFSVVDVPEGTKFRIRPEDLGADPTGVRDSTVALQQAVQQCVNRSKISPNGAFPGRGENFGPIGDAGGCLVDLDGGEYRVSQSIVVPELVANMQLGHGSIVADARTFQPGGFLLVVGVKGSCRTIRQKSCNVDLNFPELFLDGSNVANAMQFNNVMGTTVGPGGYLLNFTEYAVQINGGHEVMMDRCWLGETNFDYDFAEHGKEPKSTAIQINGNDHYILNTIVFSSKIGIEVNGAANVITGVHVWFPWNRALAYSDTMAFFTNRSGNRFTGCYVDGGRAVFAGAGLTHNFWTGGFECCAGEGLQKQRHGIILRGDSIGPGLEIFNNLFQGGNIWHEPSAPGKVPSVRSCRITDNALARNTRASQGMTQTAARIWKFDFCQQLIFPVIASVQVSLQAEEGFPRYIVRPTHNCTVIVETDTDVSGTMVVEVDSSTSSANPEQAVAFTAPGLVV